MTLSPTISITCAGNVIGRCHKQLAKPGKACVDRPRLRRLVGIVFAVCESLRRLPFRSDSTTGQYLLS